MGTPVQTVAFVGVFDLVLPLWVFVRGLLLIWPGTAGWAVVGAAPLYALPILWALTAVMPGETHAGPLAPMTPKEEQVRAGLEGHVRALAGEIGPRNSAHPEGLVAAQEYISEVLRGTGQPVERQTFVVDGREYANIVVSLPGRQRDAEVVVVGAHYDAFADTPGADDNASGVAGVLELSRLLAVARPRAHTPPGPRQPGAPLLQHGMDGEPSSPGARWTPAIGS